MTVSIELPDAHGTLLTAVEAGSALVGLAAPDGIYQYVGDDTAEGTHRFIIGHQPTRFGMGYVCLWMLRSMCRHPGWPNPLHLPDQLGNGNNLR